MAREHASIKMTPEELSAYLASFRRLIVATLDDDGAPWADAAAYVFLDDRVYFRVPTDTATYRHLRRDGLVCCVVESKPDDSTYYGIKGAMLHGRAEVLDEGGGPGRPSGPGRPARPGDPRADRRGGLLGGPGRLDQFLLREDPGPLPGQAPGEAPSGGRPWLSPQTRLDPEDDLAVRNLVARLAMMADSAPIDEPRRLPGLLHR